MRVRIDKAGQNYFASTVDFRYSFAMFSQPGIAQGVSAFADGSNFSRNAENSGILNNSQFAELWATARAALAGWRAQSQKLADVEEQDGWRFENCLRFRHLRFERCQSCPNMYVFMSSKNRPAAFFGYPRFQKS